MFTADSILYVVRSLLHYQGGNGVGCAMRFSRLAFVDVVR